ncbi:unnamed protein product [Vicia faba]|uniref:DUF4283 domain-containing protein n=1 Tax=Vicia faba TaxID=3906 RepID=A0AAV0ZH46_VICFA|nr:unnamed protein product [Vicia faba]
MDCACLFPEVTRVSRNHASVSASYMEISKHSLKSLSQALKGVCDIPTSQLPQPIIKGDKPSVTILEDEYKAGLDECKNNLYGRVIWPKVKNWGVQSLGKGYYEFTFSSIEDMQIVRASGSISSNLGSLKLFDWTRDFNPASQNNTFAQVWV